MSNYILVSANYPPHIGGVERYSQKIASELVARGNHVVVLTSSFEGQSECERPSENLEIIRLPSLWFLDDRMPVLRQTKRWREVRRKLCSIENPRMIIQTFLYPLSYAAARLARQKKWPFIVINHGCNYVCQGDQLVDRIEHVYEEILSRMVVKGSKGCYAVSQAAGEWAKHFSLPFSGVLNNAIDVEETIQKIGRSPVDVRAKYEISKNAIVVSYVGRMIQEKGIKQLIEAVQKMQEEGRDIILLAVGDGPMLDELKKQQSDRIIFTGSVEHDDVLQLLQASNCCCLPSDSEGFPTVLLEAALCKSFLIGSPYGGIPEVIGKHGTVMKGNSCEDIYNALTEFITADTQKIVNCAFERVKKELSWSNTCENIEKLEW